MRDPNHGCDLARGDARGVLSDNGCERRIVDYLNGSHRPRLNCSEWHKPGTTKRRLKAFNRRNSMIRNRYRSGRNIRTFDLLVPEPGDSRFAGLRRFADLP
jgi:hypothetical protein